MSNDAWETTRRNARSALAAARTDGGFWVGELSSSALSTAVAVFTLHLLDAANYADAIRSGLDWLRRTQNDDGGFGDTDRSKSNISTTALCWAAFTAGDDAATTTKIEAWLTREAGSLEPRELAKTIADRYGKDRTFSVPILTMLAIAGKLGPHGWRLVPPLPFELAALPFAWFQILRLPVVSYALPALIAMGLVRHTQRPTWFLPWRWLRNGVTSRCLRKLRTIQPTTGGYLEATPLTAFVGMSLIHAGHAASPVVAHGVEFLVRSRRPDGSWPIDTNLTTWVTTLAVNAGATAVDDDAKRKQVESWLLAQQYRTVHPYTMAAPGGWAWTDLAGGVPDADDTPGALLALAKLKSDNVEAARLGCEWLLNLQNGDGGIPTFCKGWTGLPFDRSSNDLTAHTLRAWAAWRGRFDAKFQAKLDAAWDRAIRFLQRSQMQDGEWLPLWFGNEHLPQGAIENATHGTARVLLCIGLPGCESLQPELERAARWLQQSQNADGGWGGGSGTPSSIEETALACEALAAASEPADCGESRNRGLDWLCEATANGTRFPATPIGFYFANLWYHEQLYPLIFTVAAFESAYGTVEV